MNFLFLLDYLKTKLELMCTKRKAHRERLRQIA